MLKRCLYLLYPYLLLTASILWCNSEEIILPRKKAIIFGVTGQDGAYLTELLLNKNYEVHGVFRPSSVKNTSRLELLIGNSSELNHPRLTLHYGDIGPGSNINTLIQSIQPDEVYNLAAQTHVHTSFSMPEFTGEINALGALRILEAIRQAGLEKKTKFYQASTSELYGLVQETPQTEKTPFYPRSPYGVAKLYAYWITINYRESFGIFACNGILFNHESPLRVETFVTRKITLAACRYYCGNQTPLYLGNLDAKRDWGYAKDYVEAMWLMLQHEIPNDYVIATGENHSVREFAEAVYNELGIEIEWHGEKENEFGTDKSTGQIIVKVDPKLFRPAEVDSLLGNNSKARQILNWTPKTSFKQLVKIMVEADLKLVQNEKSASQM